MAYGENDQKDSDNKQDNKEKNKKIDPLDIITEDDGTKNEGSETPPPQEENNDQQQNNQQEQQQEQEQQQQEQEQESTVLTALMANAFNQPTTWAYVNNSADNPNLYSSITPGMVISISAPEFNYFANHTISTINESTIVLEGEGITGTSYGTEIEFSVDVAQLFEDKDEEEKEEVLTEEATTTKEDTDKDIEVRLYPNGQPIDPNLPAAYQVANNPEQACENCVFYDVKGKFCTNWKAEVKPNYWCASWKGVVVKEEQEETSESEELTETEIIDVQIAYENQYSQFLEIQPYNWLVEKVPNITSFISMFSSMMSNYNAHIQGSYLRRVLQSQDAFNFQDSTIDFCFDMFEDVLAAVEFVNGGNLTEFETPTPISPSSDRLIYTFDLQSKGNGIPNVKIRFKGDVVGSIDNILAQQDFTNSKISTNGDYVTVDNRLFNLENNNTINIDMVKPNILKRLIEYLSGDGYVQGTPFQLNSDSSLKLLSWVAPRVVDYSQLEPLYQNLLNTTTLVGYNVFESNLETLNNLVIPPEKVYTPVHVPLNVTTFASVGESLEDINQEEEEELESESEEQQEDQY